MHRIYSTAESMELNTNIYNKIFQFERPSILIIVTDKFPFTKTPFGFIDCANVLNQAVSWPSPLVNSTQFSWRLTSAFNFKFIAGSKTRQFNTDLQTDLKYKWKRNTWRRGQMEERQRKRKHYPNKMIEDFLLFLNTSSIDLSSIGPPLPLAINPLLLLVSLFHWFPLPVISLLFVPAPFF